jgi:hypothetical protein
MNHLNKRVQHWACSTDQYAMFNVLTGPQLFDCVESLLPAHRERLYPPTQTLSMLLTQALSSDGSCQHVVNESLVQRIMSGQVVGKTNTGAYCKARKRLPLELLSTLTRSAGTLMARDAAHQWTWRGRRVRLVDGTTLSLADTAANQAVYPQPKTQKVGLGFPQCRVVALLCLESGAVLDAATAPCLGKGTDEQSLLRSMLDTLNQDDVLLGDAFYATYFLMCELVRRGVDGVFEQHGSRKRNTDFRTGTKLGARDHLVVLNKPVIKPHWMSQHDYEQAPQSLTVRELKVGGKIIVTTLLCPKKTSKEAIKRLYRSRWNVEMDLRNMEDNAGYGTLALQNTTDGTQRIMGLPVRL